jgi:hypothetical protein
MKHVEVGEVLGSVRRALIGNVTPNLRAVYVDLEEELITLLFYYNDPLSEDEEELASLTDTEFISDFPSPEYKTDCKVHVIPYPQKIEKKGYCVYRRYEK